MGIENKKTSNPSAFPFQLQQYNEISGYVEKEIYEGMNLRDYFANSAMQGLCVYGLSNGLTTYQITEMSFKIADAMLKQREL